MHFNIFFRTIPSLFLPAISRGFFLPHILCALGPIFPQRVLTGTFSPRTSAGILTPRATTASFSSPGQRPALFTWLCGTAGSVAKKLVDKITKKALLLFLNSNSLPAVFGLVHCAGFRQKLRFIFHSYHLSYHLIILSSSYSSGSFLYIVKTPIARFASERTPDFFPNPFFWDHGRSKFYIQAQ